MRHALLAVHPGYASLTVIDHFYWLRRGRLFYLCKIPKPLGDPGNSLAFFQPGSSSSSIVNEAFGVRQEGGRPQGSELEQALGGVAGKLQCRGSSDLLSPCIEDQ